MNEKISKNDLKNLIKLGYDLDLIVLEFDVPLNILEEYKKELEVPSEEKETSKEIKRLIKSRKFDDALKYTDKYPDNPVIQSQKVNIYIKKRKYREAKEIGKKFENYAPIQSQMVTIAIKERDYEKAKEIGKKFLNDEVIQLQIEKIEKKMKDENNEEIIKSNKNKIIL